MNAVTAKFFKVVDKLQEVGKLKDDKALSIIIGINTAMLSLARNGKREIPFKYVQPLCEHFSINKNFITGDDEEMYSDDFRQKIFKSKENVNKTNANYLGEINYPLEQVDESPFMDLGDGRYLMLVPLVAEYAYAGYLQEYQDKEFIEELPKHTITVSRYHRGLYRAFEVLGDSMTDGTHESILDGSIVTGRYLMHHHWQSKLHTHNFDDWVIVHKSRGILVKRIFHKDVEQGVITIKSLNPNKELYPDEDLKLDDIKELYNIVNVSKNKR